MIRRLATFAALLLTATPAAAHTGAHPDGFIDGFVHPLAGIDHLLAMVAVGLWAAQLGGVARWAMPASFVVAMVGGGVLGIVGMGIPLVELGIVASVVAMGAAVSLGARIPLVAAGAAVGLFGVFHGFAHGAEMPIGADGVSYAAGFVLATMSLHGLGMGIALILRRSTFLRPLGGAIAIAGAVLGLA